MDDLIGRLLALPKWGEGYGLRRLASTCADLLDDPWGRRLDAIKVTGSNGKGSVSAMCAAILGALGFRTGLYTSPHLRDFGERMAVDGVPAGPAELAAAMRWFEGRARASPDGGFAAFDVFTALALHRFHAARTEALVAEAGLGGRFDATRVLPGKLAALVSLDLEHAGILGPSLEAIACDKADLCPPGGTLVAGPLGADLESRLDAYCRLRQVRLMRLAEGAAASRVRVGPDATLADLTVDGLHLADVKVALAGRHQAVNAALAALLARLWSKPRGIPDPVFAEGLRHGLASVRWPARLERVGRDPDLFVDSGHTPAGVATAAAWAREALAGRPVLLVLGVSEGRDAAGIVAPLAAIADRVICTGAHHRGGDPARLVALVEAAGRPAALVPDLAAALSLARAEARAAGMAVLVAGGMFLAVEAAEVMAGRDPRALRLF